MNGEFVLIVDDSDDPAVSYLTELVITCGLQVERARSWNSVLDLLRKDVNKYRAMFLDLNLGSGTHDGFILMDRMKQEGLLVPTQIVSHASDLTGVAAACAQYSFIKTRPIPKHELFTYGRYLKAFLNESTPRKLLVHGQERVVFVAHGHNHSERDRMVSLIRGLGLSPIILDYTARQGKVLLELFEEHASEAVYAIVIMTGDDIGYLMGHEDEKKPRARQNVVFEMGFFYGKLGRDRVMCMLEPGLEKPSDIDGIVYTNIREDNQAIERRIMRELRALKIDFTL